MSKMLARQLIQTFLEDDLALGGNLMEAALDDAGIFDPEERKRRTDKALKDKGNDPLGRQGDRIRKELRDCAKKNDLKTCHKYVTELRKLKLEDLIKTVDKVHGLKADNIEKARIKEFLEKGREDIFDLIFVQKGDDVALAKAMAAKTEADRKEALAKAQALAEKAQTEAEKGRTREAPGGRTAKDLTELWGRTLTQPKNR